MPGTWAPPRGHRRMGAWPFGAMRLARRWNLQFRGWVLSSYLSRPGGGLFGRPKTRESSGRFLFLGHFPRPSRFHSGLLQILAYLLLKIKISNPVQQWSGLNKVRGFRTEILKLSSCSCRSSRGRVARVHTYIQDLHPHPLTVFGSILALYFSATWVMMCGHNLLMTTRGVSFSSVARSSFAMPANLLGRSACDPSVFILPFFSALLFLRYFP